MENKKEIILKIKVTVEKNAMLLSEHIGEATMNENSYSLNLLGWNRQGLMIVNNKTNESYCLSWKNFIESIEEENNGI